jgi:hypothetical protein
VSTLFARDVWIYLDGGATLLERVRAPPETWTTRPGVAAQPAQRLLDHLCSFVIIFGNECSNFEQFSK